MGVSFLVPARKGFSPSGMAGFPLLGVSLLFIEEGLTFGLVFWVRGRGLVVRGIVTTFRLAVVLSLVKLPLLRCRGRGSRGGRLLLTGHMPTSSKGHIVPTS